MAELIDVSEWPEQRPGVYMYPWDEWLDGRPRRFRRGVDFEPEPRVFRQAAFHAARRRAVKLTTRIVGDSVYLQAYRPGDGRPKMGETD